MSQDDPDYEVGYGKPPKNSQFKKGKSGNPKGRPKDAKGFRASLERELSAQITVREGDRSARMSKAAVLAKRLMERGLKGDMPALKMIALIDSTFPERVDDLTPETRSEVAADKTDEAVLMHYAAQILGNNLKETGDEEAAP